MFETFSGIGAQHKALEFLKNQYGFNYDVCATSEWDVDAIISYASIHYPNFKKDIKTPTDKELSDYLSKFTFSFSGKEPVSRERVLKMELDRKILLYKANKASKNIGSILEISGKEVIDFTKGVDLITYSFPCQDLSLAGSFHGFNKGMGVNSQTRSGLLWEIGRILKEIKKVGSLPKFLLLENVPNMISAKHEPDYIEWKKFLYKLGYVTKTYKLLARNFGIPQNRNRVYAISILSKNIKKDDKFEAIDENIFPANLVKETKLKDRKLKDIIKQNYSIEKYKQEGIQCIPNRTPSRKRMYDDNWKLNDFDKYTYARTLTTKQDRHPNPGVIDLKGSIIETKTKDKAKYRFLTPREGYLLMGFDEVDFDRVKKNVLRKDKLYQQAGNSIVVNAIVPVIKLIQEIENE